MAEGESLTPQKPGNQVPVDIPFTNLKEAREAVERQMVLKALLKHSGNISHSAAELGISRPTLYQLMQKLGIRR